MIEDADKIAGVLEKLAQFILKQQISINQLHDRITELEEQLRKEGIKVVTRVSYPGRN